MIQDRLAHLFDHKEEFIARALQTATEAVRENRADADRIHDQLRGAEQEQARLLELLMDRAIPEAAKNALGRKLADVERQREILLASIDGLRAQAPAPHREAQRSNAV